MFYLKYMISPKSLIPTSLPSDVILTPRELFLLIRDLWYHDFGILGFPTPQMPGFLQSNQKCKQGPIFRLIDRALSICRNESASINGVEMFCADGFYSNYAVGKGATEMYGVDLDRNNLTKAGIITRVLSHKDKIRYEQCDVFKLSGEYDFGICAGGLYHISNPQDLLKMLTTKIRTALVIQTVYSLANTSEDYFETPAPGWTWGCRFSYNYLLQMVREAGWKIIDDSANELLGNSRLEDRGSAYLLCIPQALYTPNI
ncbi:class I SAM-dependent methyltransferase [Deltaproteobacteria bacterium]|nr:class I SAM-dependent methyltransferase [Deltaproteobacteria bacterium]